MSEGLRLGVPGGGLASGDADWADADREGQRLAAFGEQRTARLLDELVGPAALIHGVKVPGLDGADIDHLVVTGTGFWVIDTKVWAPGIYVASTDNVYRSSDWSKFAPGSKAVRNVWTAFRNLRDVVQERTGVLPGGCDALAIWPSKPDRTVRWWGNKPCPIAVGEKGIRKVWEGWRFEAPAPAVLEVCRELLERRSSTPTEGRSLRRI